MYLCICYLANYPTDVVSPPTPPPLRSQIHFATFSADLPRSQIRINLSNRGMQTYFGHLQLTYISVFIYVSARGVAKKGGGGGLSVACTYFHLVWECMFFFHSLRDLSAIIKAFRGTTPIIHMMSTGKCLQHQKYDCHHGRRWGERYY